MSDPRFSDRDPRLDSRFRPSSAGTGPAMDETTGWILPTFFAALAVAGLAVFLLTGDRWTSDATRTAATPAPETTGRNVHPPIPPTQISPDGVVPAPRAPANP
jgi:hypothetical protein